MKKHFGSCLVLSFVVASWLAIQSGSAQEKKADAEKGKKAAAGRLPNNFGQVGLSDEQKNKIYAVQAKYNGEIDKLEAQIAQITMQRDTEIQAVLTAEQKTKLNDLRDAAKKKTDTGKAAKEGDAKPKEKG